MQSNRDTPDFNADFAALFENTAVGMTQADSEGKLLRVNGRFCALTGYSRDELVGEYFATITHPEDRDADRQRYAAMVRGEATQYFSEKRYVRKDGEIIWVQVTALPIRENGKMVRTVAAVLDVTELKRREIRTRAITDNATLGLFMMDERQHCVFMNPAAERITGFTLAEVQGAPLHEFIHHTRPDGTRYPMSECPIDRALPTRAHEQGEDVFVRKDGSFYPVAFTASPILEHGRAVGTVIELRDLTQERAIEVARQDAERLAVTIAQNTTQGLLMMDSRQQCTFMNPAAERITGFTLEEVRGRPLHFFVHHTRPDGRPYPIEECPIDRALPTRVQEQGEDVFVRKDGTFYPVAFTASPIMRAGVPVATVIELRDTTEEKRREHEREQLLHDLERAVHVREEFLSVASHELKTPLTPLNLRLHALEQRIAREPENELVRDISRYVSVARSQIRRLTDLVNDLLDVSRIQGGRLELHLEPVDAAALVREVCARHEDQVRRAGSELRVKVVDCVMLAADRARFDQVVENLLDNAIKYGPGKPIDVVLETRGRELILSVTDRGIGVEPEAQARIFERFERAVSDRNYGGLGLGLYIARTIVERLGGQISVQSEPRVQTTFTVRLPLEAEVSSPGP